MIEVTRHSTHSPDTLWPVMSGVRDWGSWLPTVDTVRPMEPARADEVGASYVVEQPGLPRATWTITEWDPERSFAWESRKPGVLSTGRHALVPDGDGGTSIRLSIEWTGPLAGVIGLLLGGRTRDYVTREAEALDRTAGARRTGA